MSFALTRPALAAQSAFASALLDRALPPPAGVTCRRGGTDARRFAVYRNNVYAGLGHVLERRFPVVSRLVGRDFFRMAACDFIREYPPASPLLMEYGDAFPGFLERYRPALDLAYLPDVARLECFWTDAYHAADALPLGIEALAAIAPDRLPSARLVPHPACRLIRSAHPVGSIWAAHQGDTVGRPAGWEPEAVLVVRPDQQVAVNILPPRDASFAAALLAGEELGPAAAAAADSHPGFEFGPALVGLVSLGAFCAVTQPEETPS